MTDLCVGSGMEIGGMEEGRLSLTTISGKSVWLGGVIGCN